MLSGNPSKAAKKPNYGSNWNPPMGSDSKMNERGPMATKPAKIDLKEYDKDGNNFSGAEYQEGFAI